MDHMPAMEQMTVIEHMHAIESKSTPLPLNDTKILSDEQMPAKKHNNNKLTSYKTSEDFIEATNFRGYFENYHAPCFYYYMGQLKAK